MKVLSRSLSLSLSLSLLALTACSQAVDENTSEGGGSGAAVGSAPAAGDEWRACSFKGKAIDCRIEKLEGLDFKIVWKDGVSDKYKFRGADPPVVAFEDSHQGEWHQVEVLANAGFELRHQQNGNVIFVGDPWKSCTYTESNKPSQTIGCRDGHDGLVTRIFWQDGKSDKLTGKEGSTILTDSRGGQWNREIAGNGNATFTNINNGNKMFVPLREE